MSTIRIKRLAAVRGHAPLSPTDEEMREIRNQGRVRDIQPGEDPNLAPDEGLCQRTVYIDAETPPGSTIHESDGSSFVYSGTEPSES